MLLGVDVGGTHTDAVIIGDGGVLAFAKVVTRHDHLLSSVHEAIEKVIENISPEEISRVNLSTTLTTNAIIENKIEDVCVIVSAGPGIDPGYYAMGKHFYNVDGEIDHRGSEIVLIDVKEVERVVKKSLKDGVRVFSAVTKFCTRNPLHENIIKDRIADQADFVTMGHLLSGQLNFPRRIATAYFNSAVWRLYNDFADAIQSSIESHGITGDIHVLKADGGTIPMEYSRKTPVESILSGPAASVMGIVGLCNISGDSIILDIGGTSTDIAIFADGAPLVEREGIELSANPTLVRALKTSSIGIGGDSAIHLQDNRISVGPSRLGPAMADGGSVPTLIDALNYTGHSSYGNVEKSRAGIESMQARSSMDAKSIAQSAIDYSVTMIYNEVQRIVESINQRPVYTIHELLSGKKVEPGHLYVMGGPANAMESLLSEKFNMQTEVPEHFRVANAIGAALARTTVEIELFADTEHCKLVIPNINVMKKISIDYTLDRAKEDSVAMLREHLHTIGITEDEDDIEILDSSSFNMVRGFEATGQNIRVRCQVKPGVLNEYRDILKQC